MRFLPKWKSKPIAAPLTLQAADQDAGDEILRRGGGKLGVETHDEGAVEPGRGQQPQLVALAGELEQRLLRPEKLPRMRREGERGRRPLQAAARAQRGADHGAVAAMHAVEIADRHHGAGERPGLKGAAGTARDMEGGRSLAHRRTASGCGLCRRIGQARQCGLIRNIVSVSARD